MTLADAKRQGAARAASRCRDLLELLIGDRDAASTASRRKGIDFDGLPAAPRPEDRPASRSTGSRIDGRRRAGAPLRLHRAGAAEPARGGREADRASSSRSSREGGERGQAEEPRHPLDGDLLRRRRWPSCSATLEKKGFTIGPAARRRRAALSRSSNGDAKRHADPLAAGAARRGPRASAARA